MSISVSTDNIELRTNHYRVRQKSINPCNAACLNCSTVIILLHIPNRLLSTEKIYNSYYDGHRRGFFVFKLDNDQSRTRYNIVYDNRIVLHENN